MGILGVILVIVLVVVLVWGLGNLVESLGTDDSFKWFIISSGSLGLLIILGALWATTGG